MNHTKIDWCDMSWNPITGCLHGCDYCYASKHAKRFEGYDTQYGASFELYNDLYTLEKPLYKTLANAQPPDNKSRAMYPFGFEPTFHRYRLHENGLAEEKTPQTIFVGSMCDMFGSWVPDGAIEQIFDVCASAPHHRYMFLTKNPTRYHKLMIKGLLPKGDNFWFGFSATNQEMIEWVNLRCSWLDRNTFVSVEPIHGPVDLSIERRIRWVIVGAETGPGADKHRPQRGCIEGIADACLATGTPLYMKGNIADVWGAELIQEFPW